MAKKAAADPAPAQDPAVPAADHEFWVCCQRCAHTWVAAFLPMRLAVLAQLLLGLHCPKCGIGSEFVVWMDRRQGG